MDTTLPVAPASDVAAARVFLADSRLALTILNEGRHLALRRMFGVSRQEANALTFVVALAAADGTMRTARRVAHVAPSPADTAIGGFLVREAALGVAGPGARAFPFAATLLAGAMMAGVALPELRRAVRGIRAAEHRVRERRIRAYSAGSRVRATIH